MKLFSTLKRSIFPVVAALLTLAPGANAQTANHVVISQAYGGGGNTAATYNADFVELYNPTSAAVNLVGLSIQYGSTTGNFGSSATNIKALTGTIQPGHYYLVSGAGGSVGAALPTADDTGSFNLSATAGKVALVNGTASLGNATPCISTSIVDEVSFGTGDSCAEGTAAPAGSNTTSLARKSPGVDSDNNSADFSAITPNPHNSSYTTGGTGTGTLAVAAASASPSSLMAGTSTLLSVTVTPGSSSTGIVVTANLSSVGGSASQALSLSSTANVYTYTLNVGGGVAPNVYPLPVSVADQQAGTASGSISLTVQAPATVVPIATLQGNRSTYVGTKVTTTGVVTSLLYNGFFIQTPSSTPGSTGVPEGMDIYTSTTPTVAIGDNITVTGSLQLYPAATASVTPALELTSPAIVTNSNGNPLPAPIALTTANLTPSGGLQQLTKYEGMRVSFASLTSISGTGGGSLDEVNEIYKSTGQFYATITGTPRPFREPGIDIRDAAAATAPSTVPRFDDNPERILVDTFVGLNTTPLDVSAGALFTNVTGVLDFTYSNDAYYDPSRFIPDTATLTAGYTPGITVKALALPAAGQFTVGAYNIERFFNTNAADNLDYYPVTGQVETSLAVNVTPAAYARRLAKVSLAIRHVLNNPDILALEESENGSVVKDIAAQISADAIAAGEPDPQYVGYGTDNSTTYTNDIGGISTGFLVKSTVDFVALDQFFSNSTFTPTGGSLTTVDDRPPFVLHAGVKRGAGVKDYPITVIVNHMKALPDTTVAVQQKKELQAEQLAGLIQGYQAKGEHVLAVGDFNIFEFSDGYIDEMGTVTNNTVPANTVIQPGKPGLVTPPATDLALTIPADQRHSYNEDGNAQILDHIVATADLVPTTTLVYGHLDADFPVTAYNDATTPARTSDHDPALAYLALPAPMLSGTLTGTTTFPSTSLNVASSGQVFTLTNTGEATINITSIVATGDFAQSSNCGSALTVSTGTCQINVVFTPTASGTRTGTLTVNSSNATITAASLTGTGASTTSTTTAASISSTSFSVSSAGVISVHVSCNSACGNVDYREDGVEWGVVGLDSNGNFSASASGMPNTSIGQHTVTVNYLGNAQYTASNSNTVAFSIVATGNTATTTAASISSTSFSVSSAGVISVHVSCNKACGNVDYREDGVEWGVVGLDSNGNFSASAAGMPNTSIGQHTVTTNYLGNAQYAASNSNSVTFNIVAGATTTTTTASITSTSFSASNPPLVYVHVSCNTACGNVDYREDGGEWGVVGLDSTGNFFASAGGLPNLTPGQHTVTINYLGNTQYAASQSQTLTFTVTP